MADFLFEIGVEEFPASFILPAVGQLRAFLSKSLEDQRLNFENCCDYSTCSRLALVFSGLPERQPDNRKKVTGAPKRVVLNPDGTLSKAGTAFLEKNGLTEYFFEESSKGEVIAGWIEEKGKALSEIIVPAVKEALYALSFPKSMRWAEMNFAFARPIRWIYLSINGEPVSDSFEGIEFAKSSFGHRFLSDGPLSVNAQNYAETLEAHYVMADREKRKAVIRKAVEDAAEKLGMQAHIDESLLDEVTDMVEYPHTIIGDIPEKYRSLPIELVTKVLKKDQRYFTLSDKNSPLVTKFASVLNNIPHDDEVVTKGNEKVVSARLSDAAFYFNDDLSKDFSALTERLKGVLFQKLLGTYYDKVERICDIAEFIYKNYFPQDVNTLINLRKAGPMIKNDLVTGVVFEFPDLQGIMGRYYARHAGFESDVCEAMYEHYLPINAGDELPKNEIGTILSMADKIDTIIGGFMAGMKPSGSKDKFAIRRNAIGFLTIAVNYDFDINEIIDFGWDLLSRKVNAKDELKKEISDFIFARYNAVLNFDTPIIQAATAAHPERPATVRRCAETIAELLTKSDISGLAQLYKRGCNILKKQDFKAATIDETLFEQKEEHELFSKVCEVEKAISSMNDNLEIALKILETKQPLDAFFDAVFVMHDDPKIKTNRLALISRVTGLVAEKIGEISFLNI